MSIMKNLILFLTIALVITSCGKWKGDKHGELTYYSVDYKEKDMSILDVPTTDIDAVWFEFSSENKGKEYDSYALIVKTDGVFHKELGKCQIDWEDKITFTPNTGDSYTGSWIYEKEKFTISYDLESRTEELTFIYKEMKKCKKGK